MLGTQFAREYIVSAVGAVSDGMGWAAEPASLLKPEARSVSLASLEAFAASEPTDHAKFKAVGRIMLGLA